jgi:transcriptional regulator with XRE-family HTH domain
MSADLSEPMRKAAPPAPTAAARSFGENIRQLRKKCGLKIYELALKSKLAGSTISKIENGLMSPTYDTMLLLADGLSVDMADLFMAPQTANASGRRSVTRRGTGVRHSTNQYDYEMLCADVAKKPFTPLLTTVRAHSILEFPALVRHEGVEFIYVISGTVELHTEHYEPTILAPGDSCYFDSLMGHACLSAGVADAQILWVATRLVPPLSA